MNQIRTPANIEPPPRSAYIHVPFCRHRCGYCNFTLVANRDDLVEKYLEALERELSWLEEPRPVETVYVGGGTPTHLSTQQLVRLLEIIHAWFVITSEAEFTVEANPLDVTREKVQILADVSVNRLSLGVQSFNSVKLKSLDRDHAAEHSFRSIEIARTRIPNVSLDLIFAAPGENANTWKSDVNQAVKLEPPHVSTYSLTYEPGTAFWSSRRRGSISSIDEPTERWMYEYAIDTLVAGGLEHYEVSSFARSGFCSVHNQGYWSGGEYYAAGPGASRHIDGRRETNHRSTLTYLKRVLAGVSPVAESESLDPEMKARERLVFGLRQMRGVCLEDFARSTGFRLESLVGSHVRQLTELKLIELSDTHVRLTREGLMVSDSIMARLLS